MSRALGSITFTLDPASRRQTLAALRQLEPRFLKAAVRNSVRKAGRPMLRHAKRNVAVEHGFTKKSLGTKVKTYQNGNVIAVTGPRRGPKFVFSAHPKPFTVKGADGQPSRTVIGLGRYTVKRVPANTMHLTELGTKPHRLGKGVQVGRGKDAKGRSKDQTGAQHPGTKATHALRNAYTASRAEAQSIFRREIAKEVQTQARKQAAKQAARAAAAGARGAR